MWEAATTLAPTAAPACPPFIGRSEQLHRLRGVLRAPGGGTALVTGEPGMGRTSVVRRVMAGLDMDRDEVVRIRPVAGGAPLLPLRPHLRPAAGLRWSPWSPDGAATWPGWDDHAAVADAMADRFDGRRPVVVADDAHRLDLASLLALRELRRRHGAVLLLTTPRTVAAPDPTDCLRFEPDARVVVLPALSTAEVGELLSALLGCPVPEPTASALCALTGGNPRHLHGLLARPGVAARVLGLTRPEDSDGALPPSTAGGAVRCPIEELEVVHGVMADAWALLDVERVVQVGDLVSGFGTDGRLAAMHAGALLVQGLPLDAERVLRRAAPATGGTACRMAVVRALTVAFGLHRPARARADLAVAASRAGALSGRLTAYLAWLCALDGSTGEATRRLDALGPSTGDPETVIIARLARAVTALAAGRAVDAVRDLRRALAMVDRRQDELPWLPAHLRACLIEALRRAGRYTEAATAAKQLRADAAAWRVAGALPAVPFGSTA